MDRAKVIIAAFVFISLLTGSALAAPVDMNMREVKLSYPQVYGLGVAGEKINKTLGEEIDAFFLRLTDDFNKSRRQDLPPRKLQITVDHGIVFNEKPLLSVTISEWFFSGGAHPMSYLRAFTFDTRTGERLRLADLFMADADYRAKLNEIMADQTAARKIFVFPFTPFAGVKEDQEFYLTPEGLVVYYQLYEYTPYVAGFLRFPIPWDALADILEPDVLATLKSARPFQPAKTE